MSEDRPARPPTPKDEPNCLVWFTPEQMQAIALEGQRLAADREAIPEVIARRWMEDEELLHAMFRKLAEQVGDALTLENALKVAVVAVKIHDAKQEMTRPMLRRIMETMRGKGRLGAARENKQVSGRSGSSLRSDRIGRGGAGPSRAEDDASAGRPDRVVEVGPVGIPDSEGPGDRSSDRQDG